MNIIKTKVIYWTILCAGLMAGLASTAYAQSSTNAYAQAVLPDGPLVYYPFDEGSGAGTAVDASGNGNDGVYNNVSLGNAGPTPVLGDAAGFGRSGSNYVATPSFGSQSSYSIEAWLKPNDYHSLEMVYGNFPWQTGAINYQLVSGNGIRFSINGGGPPDFSSSSFIAGQWVYLVFTYDGSSNVFCMYVNGQLSYEGNLTSVPADFEPAEIGSWAGDNGRGFDGLIDEFAIYGSALPADRVQAHYVAAGGPPFATVTNQPQDVTVFAGQTATFTVGATVVGTDEPANYQWQSNGVDIAEATNATYTTPPLTLADDGTVFDCLVSVPVAGSFSAITRNAILSVAPAIPYSSAALSISKSGTDVILSWSGTGFILQETTNLSNNADWEDVPNATNSPVSVPMGNSSTLFYRLRAGAGLEYRLGFERNPITGKAFFTLNNQSYLPVMYIMPFQGVTPDFLNSIKLKGCNGLVMQMDAVDAGSAKLKEALDLCRDNKIPVIVEVNGWEYFNYLQTHLNLNMILQNGDPLRYFPDYANPMAREEYLARFQKAAQFLKLYKYTPVIAISVGAYDYYHLPDGEVHPGWDVPYNPNGTTIPYGMWVQKAFATYLNQSDADISLPDTEQSAGSPERWEQWILFRRALVTSWVKDTLEVVKGESGLPCTLTFDLDFAQHEQFATPPFAWTDLMDFPILYYYGKAFPSDQFSDDPSNYIPSLLRTVYKEFNDVGKPMMTLLEPSSAGKITSGEDYAQYSAPFVSGFVTTAPTDNDASNDDPHLMGHTEARVDSYLDWIGTHKDQLLQTAPSPTKVLILVDKQAIYFENPFTGQLATHQIPYDIAYVSSIQEELDFPNYQYILLPSDFPEELVSKIRSKAKLLREDDYLSVLEQAQSE